MHCLVITEEKASRTDLFTASNHWDTQMSQPGHQWTVMRGVTALTFGGTSRYKQQLMWFLIWMALITFIINGPHQRIKNRFSLWHISCNTWACASGPVWANTPDQLLPACSFLLWMWRNWAAYTVKAGNAIKCFRSLDYELQIALSGFKWQVFSHRALMGVYF